MESARDQPTARTELLLLPPLELLPMWQMAVSSALSGLRHCLRHSPLEKFHILSVPSCAPEISLRLVPSKASVVIAWSPCASFTFAEIWPVSGFQTWMLDSVSAEMTTWKAALYSAAG